MVKKRITTSRIVWVVAPIALYIGFLVSVGRSPVAESLYVSDLVPAPEATDSHLQVNLDLQPPSLDSPESLYWSQIQISSILYYDGTPSGRPRPEEVCIDELIIAEVLAGGYAVNFFEDAAYPLCFSPEGTGTATWLLPDARLIVYTIPSSQGDWTTQLYGFADHTWYPYDDFELLFYPQVVYRLIYGDDSVASITTYPSVTLRVPHTAGWQISSHEVELAPPFTHDLLGSDLDRVIAVDLSRPLLEKVVQPSMVLVILVLVFFLTLVDATGTFIQGAIAVLLGIFSIREILMPRHAAVRTLLDFAVWGLYFAFAGALFHRLVYIWRKEPTGGHRRPSATEAPADLAAQLPSGLYEAPEDGQHRHRKTIAVVLAIVGGLLALGWLRARLRH